MRNLYYVDWQQHRVSRAISGSPPFLSSYGIQAMYFTEAGFFEGLKRAVEVVARHRDYPGKDELVGESLGEIDDLNRRGRLSDTERDQLKGILLASSRRPGCGEARPR